MGCISAEYLNFADFGMKHFWEIPAFTTLQSQTDPSYTSSSSPKHPYKAIIEGNTSHITD